MIAYIADIMNQNQTAPKEKVEVHLNIYSRVKSRCRVRTGMEKQNSRTFPGPFQDFFSFFKDSISSQFCIKQCENAVVFFFAENIKEEIYKRRTCFL